MEYTLRPQQQEAIDSIHPGLQLWCAQTGFGKSVVAWEASKGKRAVILTHTIALQQQYKAEFGDEIYLYMGRSHSHCSLGGGSGLGWATWCMDSNCPHPHCVPWRHEEAGQGLSDGAKVCDVVRFRQEAADARVVVTNYYAYHYCKDHLGEFDILWADEAQHTPIEDIKTVQVPTSCVPSEVLSLLRALQVTDNITEDAHTRATEGMNGAMRQIAENVAMLAQPSEYPEAGNPWPGMYSNRSFDIDRGLLTCRPVHPGNLGRGLFYTEDGPKTQIAMSATLVSSDQIGVKDEPVRFFEPLLPSPTIYYWPEFSSAVDVRFARTRQACDRHPEERGVLFFNSKREAEQYADTFPRPGISSSALAVPARRSQS